MDWSKDPHQQTPVIVTNETQSKPIRPLPHSRRTTSVMSSPPLSRTPFTGATAGLAANVVALTREHMTRASKMSSGSLALSNIVTTATQDLLPYSVYACSSQTGTYRPQNICVNHPTDQASRWASGTHDRSQYITLALYKPAVVTSITFGKFHRAHGCNLKEFKIHGGLDANEMTELAHAGLKNDSVPETFELRCKHRDVIFPIQYIKITPLATYGANFNYSIWYVELKGIKEDHIMKRVFSEYRNFKEIETTRLCLKHFRQRNMMDVFHILKNRTEVSLEHPLFTDLHRYLVLEGDFDAAERVLQHVNIMNLFQPYSENVPYSPIWRRIDNTNQDGNAPGPRGGHQMCVDSRSGSIYLLGGWNGVEDLSDFWRYDTKQGRWHLLSSDTKSQGGPSARSCHKICFDPNSRSIFLIGRYVDMQAASDTSLDSDFYRYYCDRDEWVKISDNTSREGGPSLIFDHQMCIDNVEDILYVFGGRIVCRDATIQSYSGLYTYHIQSGEWKLVRPDEATTLPDATILDSVRLSSAGKSLVLKSRVGHSMFFDSATRELVIFSGQRGKECLLDVSRYSVDRNVVTDVSLNYANANGSSAGFTQRATMDRQAQEMYVLSGYMRNQASDNIRNAFWSYDMRRQVWTKIYQNDQHDADYYEGTKQVEPKPRFAHQMVYDESTRTHYVFGGNPGDQADGSSRLGDFWQLNLHRPKPVDILRRCLYMVRSQHLREICIPPESGYPQPHDRVSGTDSVAMDCRVKAIRYLRSHIQPLVHHDNEEEQREFVRLCGSLVHGSENGLGSFSFIKTEDTLFTERTHLFERLLEYFPEDMKEPSGQLLGAVKLD